MIPRPSTILRNPQPFVCVLLYLCFGTSDFSYISFSFYLCVWSAFYVPPWLTVSASHQVLRYSRIAWHSKDSVEECSRSSQVSKKAWEKCFKWDKYLRKNIWKRDPHTRDSQRRPTRPGHVPMYVYLCTCLRMGWLRIVGFINFQVSFAKKPCFCGAFFFK